MALSVTIDLPEALLHQLESESHNQRRSVGEIIRDLVIQSWQPLPRLPDDIEAELAALPSLSDEALWLLARSTLTKAEQQELTILTGTAKTRTLKPTEAERLETLLDRYDRTILRRAQAATLLQKRGYDLSDPAVLQPQ